MRIRLAKLTFKNHYNVSGLALTEFLKSSLFLLGWTNHDYTIFDAQATNQSLHKLISRSTQSPDLKFQEKSIQKRYCKKLSKPFEVLKGHHPRGTTLREALRGNLPLRGFSGALRESLRGFCRASAGLRGGLRGPARFSEGSDPMLVTLGNCWKAQCLKTHASVSSADKEAGAFSHSHTLFRSWCSICQRA